MTEQNFFESVLNWLHKGYPDGVPPKDYIPVLALLKRSLSEEEVVKAAQTILRDAGADPVTDQQIEEAIRSVTEKEPNPEEMNQVASRLASVGWPLVLSMLTNTMLPGASNAGGFVRSPIHALKISIQIGSAALEPSKSRSLLSSIPIHTTQSSSEVKPANQPSRDVPVLPAAGTLKPAAARAPAAVPLRITSCIMLVTM